MFCVDVAGHSSLQTPSSHPSVKRAGPASKANNSNVFNFGDNRVQEYLSSLSTSSSSDSNTLPSPPPKKRKFIPLAECKAKSDSVEQPECNAGPSSSNITTEEIVACRLLSQTEFGQDLEVGSYEQVSDRLPSVSDSVVLGDVYQVGMSVEQSLGPLTRSKKRKLESDSSPEIKKVRKGEGKTKSRRNHRKHHHRSKHHKHRTEKHPEVITVD